MFDWLGSLRIHSRSPIRLELGLSRRTPAVGWMLALGGAWLGSLLWSISEWLSLGPALVALLGLVLVTLRRSVVVDRGQGTVTMDQRVFGVGNQVTIPLFHVRAVVVFAKGQNLGSLRHGFPSASKYVAYIDRRVGPALYLDEAKRAQPLLELAEAISDVAEVRLEYEAPPADVARSR